MKRLSGPGFSNLQISVALVPEQLKWTVLLVKQPLEQGQSWVYSACIPGLYNRTNERTDYKSCPGKKLQIPLEILSLKNKDRF